MTLSLQTLDGASHEFAVDRWYAEPTVEEHQILDTLEGPVLDIGCGPGRHALALNRRGVVALGIDASPTAVALARGRGASVLERSVFDRIPGAGRWRAAILLDGNIGIGGDPVALLDCVRRLVHPTGTIAVEVEGPGVCHIEELVVRLDDGQCRSPWFDWARVGVDGLEATAEAAGLRVSRSWEGGGRWFAFLARR